MYACVIITLLQLNWNLERVYGVELSCHKDANLRDTHTHLILESEESCAEADILTHLG